VTLRACASDPRLLLVFRDGWEERLDEVAAGVAPAESYGYFALRARGVDVAAVDSSLVSSRSWRALSLAYQRAYVIPRSGIGYRLDQARAVRRHTAADPGRVVVATNDSIGLPLLSLHARRRLCNPIVLMSIGLCDALARGAVNARLARRYVRLLGEARSIIVFTPVERETLQELAPRARVAVIPLGIDLDWWSTRADTTGDHIDLLAVGRDTSRSFSTLAEAVRPLEIETRIVGTLARRQGVIPTRWLAMEDDMSFRELRRRLHAARVVAVPARAAAYGSGQATALQAMAAGRPVVFTDPGWAQYHGLRAGEHYVHVPPEDPEALREAIVRMLDDPEGSERLGERGRAAVAKLFSLTRQADALLDAARSPDGA
jgi:glycosyltransferase involved in cell wall biosynthesis